MVFVVICQSKGNKMLTLNAPCGGIVQKKAFARMDEITPVDKLTLFGTQGFRRGIAAAIL